MTLPYVSQLTKKSGEREYISSAGSQIHIILSFVDMPELGAIYLGTCMQFSFSVYREKTPVFNMGENVIDGFQINKKYVAGSMVNALLGKDEIAEFINQYSKRAKSIDMQKYQELATYSAYKAKTESQQIKKFHTFMKDDLTQFNVDVLFTSEYTDDVSRITLYGCNFINNGQVMSVHDMISEYTMQFVAKDMRELHDLNDPVESQFDNQEQARYETTTRLLDGFKEFEEVIDNSIPDFGQIKIPSTESLNISPGGKFSTAPNGQNVSGQKPIVIPDRPGLQAGEKFEERIKQHEGTIAAQSNNRVKRQDGTWGPSFVDGKFVPYYDSKGNLTVGYGHLITNVNDARPISPQEADARFDRDLQSAKESTAKIMIDHNIPKQPSASAKALTEMVFQMGEGGTREFKDALDAARLGKYETMAQAMLDSQWAKQDSPTRAQELANEVRKLGGG